jgi:hypothetical protein
MMEAWFNESVIMASSSVKKASKIASLASKQDGNKMVSSVS